MELRIVKVIALVALWMGMTVGLRAQTVVEYIHTDALGTPVAITNAAGTVIERSVYEPNGQLINRPLTDGPGFTGHVQDAATGLTYMQQRYYDPLIGRFLSVDPVTANSDIGANFNRYWYANNNPYRFKDPDGRVGMDCKGSLCDRYKGGCERTCIDGKESAGSESNEDKGRRWDGQISGTPGGGMKGAVGSNIKSFLDTSFEKNAFDRYWYGDGDYTLSSGQFDSLVSSAANLTAFDSQAFFRGGVAYLAEKFSFYGSGFAGSIGSGWLISDADGKKVGFYDRYDFNAKPWGARSVMDEIKTRMVSPMGDIFRAQPYEITYGIYTELP